MTSDTKAVKEVKQLVEKIAEHFEDALGIPHSSDTKDDLTKVSKLAEKYASFLQEEFRISAICHFKAGFDAAIEPTRKEIDKLKDDNSALAKMALKTATESLQIGFGQEQAKIWQASIEGKQTQAANLLLTALKQIEALDNSTMRMFPNDIARAALAEYADLLREKP